MTRRGDGKRRKLLVIDARKAHLNPKCEEDVFVELPEKAGSGPGIWNGSSSGESTATTEF